MIELTLGDTARAFLLRISTQGARWNGQLSESIYLPPAEEQQFLRDHIDPQRTGRRSDADPVDLYVQRLVEEQRCWLPLEAWSCYRC